MTEEEIEQLAHEALGAACRLIQQQLGIEHDGQAGTHFSDDIALDNLKDYIRQELEFGEVDASKRNLGA